MIYFNKYRLLVNLCLYVNSIFHLLGVTIDKKLWEDDNMIIIIIKLLLTELGIFISAGIDGMMPDIITLIGIISLLSVFGITIFAGLGSAIVAALSKGIGFAGKSFFKGIAWFFRTIFSWIPKMHKSFKDALVRNGMSEIKAMLLSGVIVFVIILIII